MSPRSFRPEILAPAGGMESLKAAANSGADAVYLGWGELNARRNAQNFTREEFLRGVAYCKARNVKVYMTLNTIVYDREFSLARQGLQLACEAGVDGVLIQDLGLLALAKASCPQLRLCGSTQMSIHNLSGALELRDLGFSRVVLARELEKEEIRLITAGCGIETEVFVHGALCMCVSGQCYMSSVIGERSGNRGLCAGPCRLPVSPDKADPGQSAYALSLKDLSLVPRLRELGEMGVASLKIEGRMKRPEYVAAACDACRRVLDGEPAQEALDLLGSAFSRGGFTTGFYDGKRGREMFGVRGREDVAASEKVLGRLARLAAGAVPRAAVDFTLAMEPGQPVTLTASDGRHTVSVSGDAPQEARTRPTDGETAAKALAKLGGTYFKPGEIRCRIAPGLMVPVSQLNSLRRQALERLSALREELEPIPYEEAAPVDVPKAPADLRPALRVACRSAGQVAGEFFRKAQLVALPLEELMGMDLEALPDEERGKLAVRLPRVTFGDDRAVLEEPLLRLRERGVSHLMAGNLGGVRLGRELGFVLHGDFGLNLSNTLALETARRLGLTDAVLSFELNLARARDVRRAVPRGVIAYGRLPLMVTRACPLDGKCASCSGSRQLVDRKGVRFPVVCHGEYMEILNSAPLYLADKLADLQGLDFALLSFTLESPAQCREIFQEYEAGTSAPRENITRGLCYRNVL